MALGRQAAIVGAVAFGIGIGIGLRWGPFSSRRGRAIKAPVARHAGADADRPAMASRATMTPMPPDAPAMPPDAPDRIDAGPDATPPEATLTVRDPDPLVIDGGVEKQTQRTQPIVPDKRKRNVPDGSKHKVAPSPPPIDPYDSPD
jgi:hypothetical protein